MREKTLPSSLDGVIVLAAFVLANLRATMFVYLYPDTSILLSAAWIEIILWLFISLLAAYRLTRDQWVSPYLIRWRRNWLLALFILFAFVSISWSMGPGVTLFRALELFFASLLAAYIGTRYRPQQLLEFLFWFGALLLMLSVAIVYAAPKTGTMYWAPFYGAWRGLYWHRNHLASLTVLINMAFLCRALIALERRDRAGFLDAFLYVMSLVVLYFAGSATGYILFLVLHLFIFGMWLWLKVSHRLRRGHYLLLSGGIVLGLLLVLAKLDFILGLFHRDTTLTGRVGLWSYLLREVVARRPWLGHGFGAVWWFDAFREQVRQNIGWTSQPLIADNGFLDILLHVGTIGLLLFLSILILTFVRSLRYGLHHKTLSGFFPLLLVLYAVFANISFSLFAETEVFVWLLIVAVLFMTTVPAGVSYKQIRN